MYCLNCKEYDTSDECIIALKDIATKPNSCLSNRKIRGQLVELLTKEHTEIQNAASEALSAIIHKDYKNESAINDLSKLGINSDYLLYFFKSIKFPVSIELQEFIIKYLSEFCDSTSSVEAFTNLLTKDVEKCPGLDTIHSKLTEAVGSSNNNSSLIEALVHINALVSFGAIQSRVYQKGIHRQPSKANAQSSLPKWAKVLFLQKNISFWMDNKRMLDSKRIKNVNQLEQANQLLKEIYADSDCRTDSKLMEMGPAALSTVLLEHRVSNTVSSAYVLWEWYRDFSSSLISRNHLLPYAAYVDKTAASQGTAADEDDAVEEDEYEYESYQQDIVSEDIRLITLEATVRI